MSHRTSQDKRGGQAAPARRSVLVRQITAALAASGHTVAVAESLTAGRLAAALADAPGAGETFLGGVVAYATDVKARVLHVDAALLARAGAVDPQVAAQMARGARAVTGATYGLATTGVAGPAPQDGQPVGTVYVAVAHPHGCRTAAARPNRQPPPPGRTTSGTPRSRPRCSSSTTSCDQARDAARAPHRRHARRSGAAAARSHRRGGVLHRLTVLGERAAHRNNEPTAQWR
ncbi:CinA family protein [Streptomyces sp. Y1]|uniref:CinA family protein n=1 Tax=Streptomyces sp. Y1 TaxID=3238634 RepID=A0AB39TWA5_9ACTN